MKNRIFRNAFYAVILLGALGAETWTALGLPNSDFREKSGNQLASWKLHNASVVDDGVLLPTSSGNYAKLWRYQLFTPGSARAFRVTARVRGEGIVDAAKTSGSVQLRLFYYPAGTEHKFSDALWPSGKQGAFGKISETDEWKDFAFELAVPIGAEELEIAFIHDRGSRAVRISKCQIEAVLEDGFLPAVVWRDEAKLVASPVGPDGSALSGWRCTFESGTAGFQMMLLPHYPETTLPFVFETNAPGSGKKSVRIPPQHGMSSFPSRVTPGSRHQLSFHARSSGKTARVSVKYGNSERGPISNVMLTANDKWEKLLCPIVAGSDFRDLFIFINNDNPPGSPDILLDDISLRPVGSENAGPLEYSLGLSTGVFGNFYTNADPVTVEARWIPGLKENPGDGWNWVLSDLLPEKKLIAKFPADWMKTAGAYSASLRIPAAPGLYQAKLVPSGAGSRLPRPEEEILVARAHFPGLPAVPADPDKAFLGVHEKMHWPEISTTPYHTNIDSFRGERMARLLHLGARWIRLHGMRPEPTKMRYSHPKPDEKILYREGLSEYVKAGFSILGVIETGYYDAVLKRFPPWFPYKKTSPGAWSSVAIPEDLSLFDSYVGDVVEAYRNEIGTWEIWNEPNGWMPLPEYLPLLKTASSRIREKNPSAKILGICATSDRSVDYSAFMREALNRGAGDFFEVISYHPYVESSPEKGGSGELMRGVRDLSAKHGLREAWITEAGWETTPAYECHSGVFLSGVAKTVSARTGAAYLVRSLIEARSSGVKRFFPYSLGVPLFAWKPWTWSPAFEYDGTPGPGYMTVAVATRFLSDAVFVENLVVRENFRGVLFQSGPTLLAAIWAVDEEKTGVYLLESGKSAEAWDGAGRKSTWPLRVGAVPVWIKLPLADAASARSYFAEASWKPTGKWTLRGMFEPDGRFEIRAKNGNPVLGELAWLEGGKSDSTFRLEPNESKVLMGRKPASDGLLTLEGEILLTESRNPVSLRLRENRVGPSETVLGFVDASQIAVGPADKDFFRSNRVEIKCAANSRQLTIRGSVAKNARGFTQRRLDANQYLQDSVELFFRTATDEVDWLQSDFQKGDIKISLAADSLNPDKKNIQIDTGKNWIDTSKISFSFSDRKDRLGFDFQIEIPWSAFLLLQGVKPKILGFDLAVNATENGDSRAFQAVWSGTRDNWKNTQGFGLFVLE